ncbi:hypothetical protein I316_07152 [Kwoniella heveanensis BCC8398]|uniref:Uncharacterized protein n=1 Tax=Kwoniella heveanensis BCC8398 TaxID=1296120 RepID=A0A1B9GJB3_9TREE|nr:hypothetical protein I316_07152 [Kwoniella heveanensis BCC8398]
MPKRPITSTTSSNMSDEDQKQLLPSSPDSSQNEDTSSAANTTRTLKASGRSPSTPKRAKKDSTTTNHQVKRESGGTPVSSPDKGKAFPKEAKKVLVERALDLAYKGLPYAELAQELGISESRLKDQFKPGRSNIRKAILDLYQ